MAAQHATWSAAAVCRCPSHQPAAPSAWPVILRCCDVLRVRLGCCVRRCGGWWWLGVCTGALQNLTELSRRLGGRGLSRDADPNNSGGGSLERKGSIERSLDLGATTASLVLQLYLAANQDGTDAHCILLSELQVSQATGTPWQPAQAAAEWLPASTGSWCGRVRPP